MKIDTNFILLRLKEAGTWRGILILLAALGIKFPGPIGDAIVAIGCTLAVTVQAMLPELGSSPVTHAQIKSAVQDAMQSPPGIPVIVVGDKK